MGDAAVVEGEAEPAFRRELQRPGGETGWAGGAHRAACPHPAEPPPAPTPHEMRGGDSLPIGWGMTQGSTPEPLPRTVGGDSPQPRRISMLLKMLSGTVSGEQLLQSPVFLGH